MSPPISFFEYLTPSRARRRLLNLLWRDRLVGSIRQLAKLAEVPYAAAHSELSLMEKAGLAVRERRGRALVYRLNEASPHAPQLVRLLASPSCPSPRRIARLTQARTLEALAALGAPILAPKGTRKVDNPEEVLAAALGLARRNPAVARGLPVVLARWWPVLDRNMRSGAGRRALSATGGARRRPHGQDFGAPFDVLLDNYTIVVAVLVHVRNENREVLTDKNIQGAPDLVIEILSPSTPRVDQVPKLCKFAERGVAHYWIVDPAAETSRPWSWPKIPTG